MSSARSAAPKPKELDKFSERTRAMNLYRAFIGVLGCKEEMWEELKMLQRSRPGELAEMGWEERRVEQGQVDKAGEEQEARSRFDELFERFQS